MLERIAPIFWDGSSTRHFSARTPQVCDFKFGCEIRSQSVFPEIIQIKFLLGGNMRKQLSFPVMIIPLFGLLVAGTAVAGGHKITICHKYDTPDQATIDVGYPAMAAHLANHGDWTGACPESDKFVDVDGIASPDSGLPGSIDVAVGDTLTAWPTGIYSEGIDHFDNDGTCTWTNGDDLHLERPGGACPTGIGDGRHQLGADCVVLDADGSLYDNQQVDLDLETDFRFTGCPGVDPQLMFYDGDGNGFYDNGEDIVFDANSDGVFN
jgi:hypothetical protein